MADNTKIVAVFGSYLPKSGELEYETARELGRRIAAEGWTLINGGYGGTMEAGARGAEEAHGRTIGVTVAYYHRSPNRFTDEAVHTENLWERLRVLVERADAYVVLPGATGTLAEIGVAWEFLCKKLTQMKPLVFLGDFWTPLYRLMVADPHSPAACGGNVKTVASPQEAVDFLKTVWKL